MTQTNTQSKSRISACRLGLALVSMCSGLVACVEAPKMSKSDGAVKPAGASKYDPSKATVAATVETKEMDGIVKGGVPSLTMTYTGGDSAEVWRCVASYKLVYGNGRQELSALSKSDPSYRETAKEAFNRMRTDGSRCVAIATNASTPTVNDYGAQSGNFYYIINPCVSQAASTTGRAGCSYDLQMTQPLQYTNTRASEEVAILSDMYKAEGTMYNLFAEMKNTLESANAIATTCVLDEADRLYAQQRMFGLIKLVTAIAAPIVNVLVPGVGTALSTAVGTIVNLKQQQSMVFNSDCPAAKTKMEYYNELVGKVDQTAKDVLEKRQKLNQLDQQYANVDKELADLRSNAAK